MEKFLNPKFADEAPWLMQFQTDMHLQVPLPDARKQRLLMQPQSSLAQQLYHLPKMELMQAENMLIQFLLAFLRQQRKKNGSL